MNMKGSIKVVSLFALLNSTVSFAVEFRGASIGKTCDSIIPYEQALGHEPKEGSTQDWYSFNVSFLGRDAGVVYACSNAILQRGFYSLVFPSLSEANEFFPVALEHLKSIYGQPKKYALKAGYGSIGYWNIEDTTIQLVVTNKDDVQANISIYVTN